MDEKSFYDRGNFFLTAQALFANAFATLAVSSNLVGVYKFLPIIICLIGIAINIAWLYSSYFSDDVKNIVKLANLKDIIYKWAPWILVFGWGALMIAFGLQAFGIIRISL